MKTAAGMMLRGALGFAAGAFLTLSLVLLRVSMARTGPGKTAPMFMFYAIIASFGVTGALGAAVLTWRVADAATTVRAAIAFGAGFIIMSFGSLFTMISLQGSGRVEYAWAAAGFGVSFAVGAAIGTLFLQPRLAPLSALAFGILGAAGGVLLFRGLSVLLVSDPVGSTAIAAVIALTGFFLPYIVGGATLGAMLAASDTR